MEGASQNKWIGKQSGRADADGSQLTRLASVIILAKVNVYRCRKANARQCSVAVTGQWDWLTVILNGS